MDKKNSFFGILLVAGALGLIYWQSNTEVERIEQAQTTRASEAQMERVIDHTPASSATEEDPFKTVSEVQQVQAKTGPAFEEKFYKLENETIAVYFTNKGGAIDHVELKDFPEALDADIPYTVNDGCEFPALSLSLVQKNGTLKFYAPEYEMVGQSADRILFRHTSRSGVEIIRGYSLPQKDDESHDPYVVLHETKFSNKSTKTFDLSSLYINVGTYPRTHGDASGEYLNFGYYDGNDADFVKIGDLKASSGFFGMGSRPARSEIQERVRPILWGSVKNQFFTSVLTPNDPATGYHVTKADVMEEGMPAEGISGSIEFDLGHLEKGQSKLIGMQYYVGPKEFTRLDALGANQDLVMQFGFLSFISKLLLISMKGIHSFVPNWGLTIIILTVIIKTCLWPLTAVQVRSSRRMAKIQGPLKEIKEKYKDSPQKVQAETMKLFRENRVNPAAGCLPLLIQMPIFLGLYFMLRTASELRFAHFLWIPDLSVSDTVAHIAGFPINILPLIMGVSMFIQMQLMPTPTTDSAQQKMLKFMPAIFLIFCYNFPSGLVLYWTVQNILTIIQQRITGSMKDPMETLPAQAEAPKKSGPKAKSTPKKRAKK